MLTLRGLAMTDETASEFTGTLLIHRAGSPEPVESVRIRIKRSVLEEMAGAVQRVLAHFENARMPLGRMKLSGMWGMHDWPQWMSKVTDESARLPRVPAPEDIYVMVGGGSGKHSCVLPNCTFSRAVTVGVRS